MQAVHMEPISDPTCPDLHMRSAVPEADIKGRDD